MSANIVLSRADFSANNIGRVVEYDPMTLAILAKQTQYAQGSTEADALNTFIVGLRAAGLLGVDNAPIKSLIIPALAASYSELGYNIAQFAVGYPVNDMPSAEAEAETKVWSVITSGGHNIGLELLYNSSSAEFKNRTQLPNYLNLPASGNCPDTSLFYFNLKDYSAATLSMGLIRFADNTNAYPQTIEANFRGAPGNTPYGFYGEQTDSLLGFQSISLVGGLTFSAIGDNATMTETNLPMASALPVPRAGREYMYIGQNSGANINAKTALFGTGIGITPTQMNTFKGLVSTLLTALHISI